MSDRPFALFQLALLALAVALPEVGDVTLIRLALCGVARLDLGLPIRTLDRPAVALKKWRT
jgi:hypothetical protein